MDATDFIDAWTEAFDRSDSKIGDWIESEYERFPSATYDNEEYHADFHYLSHSSSGDDLSTWTNLFVIVDDPTLQSMQGADDILSDFASICENFYRDDSNLPDGAFSDRFPSDHRISSMTAELCFLPTESVLDHLRDNLEKYINSTLPAIDGVPDYGIRKSTAVSVRLPDQDAIAPIFINHSRIPIESLDEILASRNNDRVLEKLTELYF